MRRLIRRDRRERGAVAVVVAISMVVVMGFVAISVDVGSIYSDQQQLQNGADAGALAIAESCQRGTCIDSADKYTKANKLDGQATGKVVNKTAGSVTVEADSTHENWFAGVLGIPTSNLRARATATMGWPSGGPTLPLAFSWCEFDNATGGWDDQGKPLPGAAAQVVVTLKEKTCTNPAHTYVAGGFGWLKGDNCVANVLAGNWVVSDTGINGANSCTNFDWTTVLNKPVQVPIFQNYSGSGSNAEYQIKGLASFIITAYCFGPSAQWPATLANCPSNRRIQGYFVNYTDLSGSLTFDPDAAHFGTGGVKLSA